MVSLDYRLAPKHVPTATEDCYAALLWITEHADELGVDPSRIAVGGGSAGGNLAAVVALMARDRGGPDLVLQVLEYAVFDFTTPSKEMYIDLYLGDRVNTTNPYTSPLLAPDLSGLPPALVIERGARRASHGGHSVPRSGYEMPGSRSRSAAGKGSSTGRCSWRS